MDLQQIYHAWELACNLFEDKSTEWLLQYVADQCNCEVKNVVEALEEYNEEV